MTSAAGQDLKRSWTRIAARLRAELGEDLFSSWFARMEPEEWTDGRLAVSVPTRFLRNWIDSHYQAKLRDISAAELGPVTSIQVRVRGHAVPPREVEKAERRTAEFRAGPPQSPENGSPLDPAQTFETFVSGSSNALALAAAHRAASAILGALPFNPLFIHGPPGIGKTHLLHAIAWRIGSVHPARRVTMLTAERFMVHFFNAIRQKDTLNFKERLGNADALLIDDFQFLQGKASHQEFCHTFSGLVDSGRQVVLAADAPPSQLDAIDQRMRSRLLGGLTVDIEPPDPDLKRAILLKRLETVRARGHALDLAADAIDIVAAKVSGGGREIEGALNRLAAWQQFNRGAQIGADLAAMILRDFGGNADNCRVRIEDILRVVGKHFNVARADLLSARRARTVVLPRQIGMYLAKRLTPRSLPEIGRRFGNKDHSTVLHAVRKIEGLVQADERLAREVAHLVRLLEQGS